jgi:hypothetical protein
MIFLRSLTEVWQNELPRRKQRGITKNRNLRRRKRRALRPSARPAAGGIKHLSNSRLTPPEEVVWRTPGKGKMPASSLTILLAVAKGEDFP